MDSAVPGVLPLPLTLSHNKACTTSGLIFVSLANRETRWFIILYSTSFGRAFNPNNFDIHVSWTVNGKNSLKALSLIVCAYRGVLKRFSCANSTWLYQLDILLISLSVRNLYTFDLSEISGSFFNASLNSFVCVIGGYFLAILIINNVLAKLTSGEAWALVIPNNPENSTMFSIPTTSFAIFATESYQFPNSGFFFNCLFNV